MASLAACSTRSAGVARKAACCKGRRTDRLQERHWVKGAHAGWKAGRRLQSLPHNGRDTEAMEKSKPQRTRRARKKQTTEGTEDTEIGREGAAGRGGARGRAGWMAFGAPAQVGIVWLCRRDRRHGKPGGLLHGGGGGLKWSAQSCGPRRQSWRRLALGTPVQPGVVFLCRRDRRHGKPGGLLHFAAAASQVERGGVRAGWRLELTHRSGLCGSAGVTAGMASLAACSTRTGGVASVAAWSTGGGRGWAGERAGGFDFGSRAAHNCRLRRIG